MLRKIGYGVVLAVAAAALLLVGWPASPSGPVTVINRVDAIAILLILAAVPPVAARRFGPAGAGWPRRLLRAAGYLILLGLVLIKSDVERFEYAALPGRSWLAGLWAGELIFLAVTAVYLTGLLAVTAARPPAGPAALTAGLSAGAAAGLVAFALPPVGNPLHVTRPWLAVLHGLGWGIAVPVLLGAGLAAGLAAARRAAGRGGRLARPDARTRQAVMAGLCAGAAAALLVSLAGISAAALLPHQAISFHLSLSAMRQARNVPAGVYEFELSIRASAAGYLLVLVTFPALGAGLGAWGGLFAIGRGGDGGGGGGGGGGDSPQPDPPPGGRRLDHDGGPAFPAGYLHELPGLADLISSGQRPAPAPDRAGRRAEHCGCHLGSRRGR